MGNIGDRNIELPVYNTKYKFHEPKQVVISTDGKDVVNTYAKTLMDTTLFAIKSLLDDYPRYNNSKCSYRSLQT